jgi:lipid biosynthesis B12-binding/radical SAM protein
MKILILSANVAETPFPVYPLGASVVCGALRKAGHEVRFFDFLEQGCSVETVGRVVDDFSPGVVGVSIRNVDNVNCLNEQHYIKSVRRIVEEIRRHTGVGIVVGGSGFSIMPELILKKVGGDYGIVGEGERAMVSLVERIASGSPPEKGTIITAPKLKSGEILAADYDSEILNFYLARGKTASVQTKRGCTHKCIYCSYPALEGTTIRTRNPSDVVDDIERLVGDYGTKCIFFTDSVFNDDGGRYLEVLEEMKRRRVCPPWTAFFKPAGMDDRIVGLMKETGLYTAEIGSDATTDTTLRKIGKNFLFRDVRSCSEKLVEQGITVAHYFMFGCPGETEETVREGIENIKALKGTVSFVFLGIRILPNTPLLRISEEHGVIEKGRDMLDPVYYISPKVDAQWLEETLREAFSSMRTVMFPPDAMEDKLRMLHKMDFSGSALEFLV